MWYEGNATIGLARIRGTANFTMRGSQLAVPADRATAAFDVADLKGTVTLLVDGIDDRIAVSGQSAGGRVLAIGLMRPFRTSAFVTNNSDARTVMLNSRQRVERQGFLAPATTALTDIGEPNPAFIRDLLARSRSTVLPSRASDVPEGATDLALYRVLVDNGREDLVVTGRTRD